MVSASAGTCADACTAWNRPSMALSAHQHAAGFADQCVDIDAGQGLFEVGGAEALRSGARRGGKTDQRERCDQGA